MTQTARSVPARFLAAATEALGPSSVVADPDITATHGVDWTGLFCAPPPLVLRPRTTGEVAALVSAAREHAVSLVPQGGNTSLVGGATPCDGEVVVDLRAIDFVGDVDVVGGQLTAGAGATVADVQRAAAAHGWAYGVDWTARDSATIGGSVATNAGGLRFVRHGDTRRQLLGVEAVLGDATTVRHLPRVAKDNSGYNIATLLCGSEGTLGIVTAARLRLVAPPGPLATAFVGFTDARSAVAAASSIRRSSAGVEALELMTASGIDLVRRHLGLGSPLRHDAPIVLLVEIEHETDPASRLSEAVAGLVGVVDAAVATESARRRDLWIYREAHTAAINRLGPPHKFDVTLPPSALAGFIDAAPALVRAVRPSASVWCFGHAGDGNVHVNVTGLPPADETVAEVVLNAVLEQGGSISAEHGIGRAKRNWISRSRTASDIAAMRAIKAALDPDGICNPHVLLPSL